MTDTTIDPFEAIRRELLVATTRDVRRRTRRRHTAGMVAIAFGALVLLTGIAAAASDDVADVLSSAGDTMLTVLDGPPAKEAPSTASTEILDQMERSRSGDASREAPEGKVLLHDTFDGHDIEIVATNRPQGSPTNWGAQKSNETCYTLVKDGRMGSAVCSPVFIPGIPSNYAVGIGSGPDGISETEIHGVLAGTVVAVNLVTPDGIESAIMGDRAFYWRSEDVTPTHIEFVLADGSSKRAPINGMPSDVTSAPSR